MKKLNLGCGRFPLPDSVNLDSRAGEGVDYVFDLDACSHADLPFKADYFDEIHGSHVLEHIKFPLPMMEQLHRVAKDGAVMHLKLPYGSSDDAFEDPTHVRQYFLQSFGYFSQPYYWRADYGYRGDWQAIDICLSVDKNRYPERLLQEIRRTSYMNDLHSLRNVVSEMTVNLQAIKPIREPKRELQVQPTIRLIYT